MPSHELDVNDLRDIAGQCIAPSAALLLDVLDEGSVQDAVLVASSIRDAAQAIIDGHVRA